MNGHGHAPDDTEMAFHCLSEQAMQRYVSSQRQFAYCHLCAVAH